MTWRFWRWLLYGLSAVAGAAFGALLKARLVLYWPSELPAEWVGAALSVAALAVWDIWHASRFMTWLGRATDQPPPMTRGMWGEAAQRVLRLLHQRDRQAQTERERLADFLRAIEASPSGVMLLDANECIEWCSRRAAQHLGLDPQRDIRQRVTNLVRAPVFVAHLQQREFDAPVKIPAQHGGGMLSIDVQPYGAGQYLLLTQDVTERERGEAMRRDFVANVSHEIRTPLTVLSGFIETMSTLTLTDAERSRMLTLMAQQTRRMQALVDDLLVLARLEGSPAPALDDWVPIAKICEPALSEARNLSQDKHRIESDVDPLAELAGNPNELTSAVVNLLNNAVRYTPAGGSIRLQWRWRDDGGGELSVRDTGPGIAAEHLPRLTERFYRVDNSRSRDTGGTGLGLAIVKHVAQRHGGELKISSTIGIGHGSCFSLLQPAARVRRLKPLAAAASSHGASR